MLVNNTFLYHLANNIAVNTLDVNTKVISKRNQRLLLIAWVINE